MYTPYSGAVAMLLHINGKLKSFHLSIKMLIFTGRQCQFVGVGDEAVLAVSVVFFIITIDR
jgi:hypothetical protein